MQGKKLVKKKFKFIFQPVIVSVDCKIEDGELKIRQLRLRKSFDFLHHKSTA
jgi:hypothetical protein